MTIEELAPNAVNSNTSSRFKTESGTTFATGHVSKLSDLSDSTYATLGSNDTTTLVVALSDSVPITGDSRIAAIRTRGRFIVPKGHQGILKLVEDSTVLDQSNFKGGTRATYFGDWIKKDRLGVEWGPTAMADLTMQFTAGSALSTLYRYVLEYDIRDSPVASPAWPINGSFAAPTAQFSWSYQQDQLQTQFDLLIFDAATAEAGGGWEPTPVDAVARVQGVQNSPSVILYLGNEADYSHTPDGPMLDLVRGDTYYWALRVAQDFNGETWWGQYTQPYSFVYQGRPTLDAVAPIGDIDDSTSPLVDWTFTDTENSKPQQAYAVKVFEEPVAGWGGFNPGRPWDRVGETTAPITRSSTPGGAAESSVVRSATTQWQIPRPLKNNTTYRAYIWAQQADPVDTRRGPGEWEINDEAEFTIDIAQHAAPAITVQAEPENGRMSIEVVADVADTDSVALTVLRSTDGVNFTSFPLTLDWFGGHQMRSRRMTGFAIDLGGGTNQFYDYSMPLNKQVYYRAYTIRVVTGSDIAGLSSTDNDLVSSNRTWFSDPYGDGAIVSYPVQDDWLVINRPTPRTIHKPIGRSRALVNRGQTTGDEFTVNFLILGEDHFNEFMEWLETRDTWMFRNEDKAWWVQVAGDIGWEDYLWDNSKEADQAAQKAAVPFVEVADPDPDDEIEA